MMGESEMATGIGRPKNKSPEVLARAAQELAKQIAMNWDGVEGNEAERAAEVSNIAGDLQKVLSRTYDSDGYSLAKALEDYHGWDPDASLVEMLDGAFWAMESAHRALVADWVASSGVSVPFAEGDQVQSPKGVGTVTKIDAQHAKVNVRTPEQAATSAWVFDAEQCSALPA